MTPTLLERRAPSVLVGAACLGLAAANALRPPPILLALVAAALCFAAAAVPRGRFALIAVAVAVGGLALGGLRLASFERTALAPEIGRAGRAEVVVTGPVRRTPFALRVPVVVRRFERLAPREPALLELPVGRSPPQGAVLDLVVSIRAPRGPTGGFDERAWLARRGAHVVLRGRSWTLIGRRGGLGGAGDRLRAHVDRALAAGARGERLAVLAGVVLGEDEGLSEGLRDRFRASGLYHLLAVSGQNVAFLAIGVLGAAWLLGIPRALGQLGVLLAIGGYVLAVGWQPSVVRAGVAGALASLAWLAARPRDRWHFLLLGALVLLAWTPASLLDPGFQLSFAAVAAIFVAVPRVERRLEGYPLPRLVGDAVAVSVASGVATAPILWLQFGAVPLWSVPANALAAPVVGPLLGLGLLAAALEPILPRAALALSWADGWLAAYLAAVARLVGGLPLAQVGSGWVLLAIGLIGGALATRRRAAVAAAAVALAVAGAWRALPPPVAPPPKGLRVTFLDVGQGDAVLLQTAAGAVLVDAGPPEARVASQLRRLGVRRLAAVVLTHPQRDHVGGAADVLERVPAAMALVTSVPAPSGDERRALAAASRRGAGVTVARAGAAYRLGKLRLRVVSPAAPETPGGDPNRDAIVLVASYGQVDVLLTADAESDVTGPLRLRPVEVLKVAHHGSADAGLPALLRRLRPAVAVISVGAGNPYGHPAPSTLAALRGVRTFRTDRDGAVVVETDGRRLAVRTG